MPHPPRRRVVPLGKYLLHPLHNPRQFKPIRRPDIKPQPVILNSQPANLEGKPQHGLPENPGEHPQHFGAAEKGFAVVNTGADFVPHPLSKNT
jgi:hypothetical protein